MDVFEAIHNRRSLGKVKSDSVDKALIEKLLEAAIWAPNHYYTEPWRFFVLTGEGRRPLGRVLAEIAAEKMDDPYTQANQEKLQKAEQKPFRAPVVIVAAVVPSGDPKVIPLEEIGAVNCAIQNMLLAAHSLGLGAMWRTGEPAYHSKMKKLFGLRAQDEVLGFIYAGYPDTTGPSVRRTPFENKTKWIDSDQA
jgi:nitroreductase